MINETIINRHKKYNCDIALPCFDCRKLTTQDLTQQIINDLKQTGKNYQALYDSYKELEAKYLEAVEALRWYVMLCGNTAYMVDREGLQHAYQLAQKVFAKVEATND